ncbi:hypothetical protein JVT61DRAFT_3653 [Boletus reticuloceps]|uniref:Uncharacterized protein n=1 Tax=Boletus reticuloceps TaxID=495285 RepID=A0A8I3A9U8_9AGAM|nr:hypothetical protein JVT61DRAFT_3653 [Boletus reticuloceps]
MANLFAASSSSPLPSYYRQRYPLAPKPTFPPAHLWLTLLPPPTPIHPFVFTFDIPSIIGVTAYPTWNRGPHCQDRFRLITARSRQGRGNPIVLSELKFGAIIGEAKSALDEQGIKTMRVLVAPFMVCLFPSCT